MIVVDILELVSGQTFARIVAQCVMLPPAEHTCVVGDATWQLDPWNVPPPRGYFSVPGGRKISRYSNASDGMQSCSSNS